MADLIIGAAGFLASELARQLHATGRNLLGAIQTSVVLQPGLWEGILPMPAALDAIEHLPNLDVVYLLASAIPYAAMDTMTAALQATNVGLPTQVAAALQNRQAGGLPPARLIFASSTAVYGKVPSALPIFETTPLALASAYGQTKLAGEQAAHAYPDTVSLRFSSLYGPGMVDSTFLPRLVAQAKTGNALTIYGTGSRQQDYLHVADAATMLIAASKAQPGIYLGVNGTAYSNLEVAKCIARLVGGIPVHFAGEDNANSWVYDPSFSQKALGFAAQIGLEQGLITLL